MLKQDDSVVELFQTRWHRWLIIGVNLFMQLCILIAFYPVNLLYAGFSFKRYVVLGGFALLLGIILYEIWLTTLLSIKKGHIHLFLKHKKRKIKIFITLTWLVIIGITFIFTSNFLISLFIGTAPTFGFYYGISFLYFYINLVESRKDKFFFNI